MVIFTSFLLLNILIGGVSLAQLSSREIYKKNSDSVVLIISRTPIAQDQGTGSIIGDGLVLTNAHVVLDNFGEHASQFLFT